MMPSASLMGSRLARSFALDVAAHESRRNGHRVRLGRQPMVLLILLVERRGQLGQPFETDDSFSASAGRQRKMRCAK